MGSTVLALLEPFHLLRSQVDRSLILFVLCLAVGSKLLKHTEQFLHVGAVLEELSDKLLAVLDMLKRHSELPGVNAFLQHIVHQGLRSPEFGHRSNDIVLAGSS